MISHRLLTPETHPIDHQTPMPLLRLPSALRLAFAWFSIAAVGGAEETLWVARPLTKPGEFTAGIEGPACDAAGNVFAVNFGEEQTIGRVMPDGRGEVWVKLPGKSTGNGIVYSSRFCSDDEARSLLMKNLTGPPITEPRQLKFRTGRRLQPWHRNCVALGLAAGFLEPLESTSIHLICIALIRLMRLFPFTGEFEQLAERFNTESKFEWEEVRDFIILHYKQIRRDDSPMWNHYRTMEVPRNVTHRIEIFRRNGYVWPDKVNLFRIDSWLQVMMGQGVFPERHHGAARIPGTASLQQTLEQMRAMVDRNLAQMPDHQAFIDRYCPIPRSPGAAAAGGRSR